MATLNFADPASVPSTVSIGSDVIRLDIVDNDGECMYIYTHAQAIYCMCIVHDVTGIKKYIALYFSADIFIGYEIASMTYDEIELTHQVTIIKGAGNVTEQTIVVAVNLVQTAPPGSGFDMATPSDENGDNDLAFGTNNLAFIPPGDDRITVPFTIFSDELPENTEAAQLTLEAPTDTIGQDPPPRFELLPEFPTFFIVIEDDDRKLLCVVACFAILACTCCSCFH